jgi:hypothetical protein
MMAYARLSTRNTSGLHPNLRGLGFLGDSLPLSPTTALQQAIAAYSGKHLNPRDFQSQGFLSDLESEIASGQINLQAYSPSCGSTPSNVNLFQTATGLAVGTTGAGIGIAASAGVIAAATAGLATAALMGVGVIFAVIDLIFAHHAAAVQRDLRFGCSTIPAVNNAFSLISQAVQNGQLSPSDAPAALWQVYSKFMSLGGASGSSSGPGGIPGGGTAINDSPYCNSDCEISVVLYAMCLYWQAQYQAMAAQAAANKAEAVAQAAEQASTPAPLQQSLTSPAVPASALTTPTGTAVLPVTGLSAVPAWGWLALAAVGAWAVL